MPTLNAKGLLYSLWLLLLISCSDEPGKLQPLGQNATLLAFGDSLTYGTGASTSQSYPQILETLTARTVINAGVPGELSGEAVGRLATLLDRVQPDLLLLCHGGNDLLRKLDPDTTGKNLLDMIYMAQARGVEVMLIGVPGPGLLFLEPHALYDRVAEISGVVYLPDSLPELESTPSMKSDAIHLNDAGYRALAEAIHRLLIQAGALTE